MLRQPSSDEEEDSQSLVPHDELKPLSPHPNHQQSSVFEIANNLKIRIGRRLFSRSWQCYLLLICLPLILIPLLFSLDLGRLFRTVTIVRADFSGERMREAELRAIFLLRNQQVGLMHLRNRTGLSSEEFGSAVMDQVKLNRRIQGTLLSAHGGRNESVESVDDNVDGYFCRKVDRLADRRRIEWKPKIDRFLFAICLSGQMSNHLICLEKHMFFAAILGRVLVFPSRKVDYEYSQVLDVGHINRCLGREVVISYDDFVVRMKNKLKVDRFICYVANPPCYLDEEHIKRLRNLGISLGKVEAAWPEDAELKVQKKRVVADVVPKFSSDDEVIAIGDMFYADVEEEWVMQPGGPIDHSCKALIQPNRLILLTAQRFVQTFLGRNFVALHFRRHGFLKFCNVKKESCFYPIPQAAKCILRVVERANAPVIYLSTDAAESETNLLQSLIVLDGKPVPLVIRPTHNSVEKWDALLYRNHLGGDVQVEAMLDKTIAAMSTVFIGAPGSTFTEDILRLRRGWGVVSKCDEYLCKDELPNFIAETE